MMHFKLNRKWLHSCVRRKLGRAKFFFTLSYWADQSWKEGRKKVSIVRQKKVLAKSFTSTSLLGPDIFSLRPLDSCGGLHIVNFTNILRAALSRVAKCCSQMRFQSQVDQTKVVFDNQGKNAMQCITFSSGKFQLKLKTHTSKKPACVIGPLFPIFLLTKTIQSQTVSW